MSDDERYGLPAEELLDHARPPKGVVAVATALDGRLETATTGRSAERDFFELGSITKTVAATALAQLVRDGTVAFDTTVGDLLGARAGGAQDVTLEQLATHTSGLPRLGPGASRPPFWPRDPYRFYGRRRTLRGLRKVAPEPTETIEYSNYGFTVLGLCLAEAAQTPIDELLTDLVLRPAGMPTARVQPCRPVGLLRGHGLWIMNARWHAPVVGAGGIDVTIVDLAAWLSANLDPSSTDLGPAVRLAQEERRADERMGIGLAWIRQGDLAWHNGATGGFQSFLGIQDGRGLAMVASHSPWKGYLLDDLARAWFGLRQPGE